MSILSHRWEFRPKPDSAQVHSLMAQLGTTQPFPEVLASILVQRGISSLAEAKAYYRPSLEALHDPFLMADMAEAVERLLAARHRNESILLFGDYDVDGTCSVALMKLALAELGFNVHYYIPDRYDEGYGVSFKGIDHGVEIGASLMITLDCGIKAIEKIAYANVKGMDVIICDHHTPGDMLPDALATLDPKRPDCAYPYKELTGCGVGMKLLLALVQAMKEENLSLPSESYNPFDHYADLLTLSIACDIVPITGENRIMAHFGLEKLRKNPLPGIAALKAQAQDSRAREWNISDLVFFIGPRINAAGRLEHANGAVEVLLGQQKDLIQLADALHTSNEARKDLDKQITEEALALIPAQSPEEAHTTVLFRPDWHKGVIGIVASRMVEHYYRPTIMLTANEGKLVGSARSVPGFDLYAALESCDEHLLQWGGHTYAAGLTMREEALPAFQKAFEQAVAMSITAAQKQPVLRLDGELPLAQVEARFIRLLNRMEPFGPSNRRPVFFTKGVKVLYHTVLKEAHVKLTLQQGSVMIEAIGFQMAEKFERMKGDILDVAFQPFFNTWNGKTRINLRLKDIRPSYEAS